MTDAPLHDPWETPVMPLDPEIVATSQRLMAEFTPNPDLEAMETVPDAKEILIRDLLQEKQRLLERNAQLVAEVAQLRAANQRLMIQAPPQPHVNWFTRLFGFWVRSQSPASDPQSADHPK